MKETKRPLLYPLPLPVFPGDFFDKVSHFFQTQPPSGHLCIGRPGRHLINSDIVFRQILGKVLRHAGNTCLGR